MAHSFKKMLAAGEMCRVFAVARMVHPVMLDMFGLDGGYHGFWIDQEHGGMTYEQVTLASVCARANGMDTVVRMAPSSYAMVTQYLEAGAGGVMAAQIHSAAQAEEFVRWAKFTPRGMRGMNSSGRDADYTFKPQQKFAVDSNRDNLVSIQIETLGSLDQVDEIAAIDGVDLLFVGPSDLSQCLGVLAQWEHPKLWEAIGRVSAACKKHGKHWGTVSPTPAYVDKAIEYGCRMMSFNSDAIVVRRGLDAVRQTYAKYFQ